MKKCLLADIVMMNEKDADICSRNENGRDRKREAQLIDLIPKVAEIFNIRSIAGTHRSINSDNSTLTLRGYHI